MLIQEYDPDWTKHFQEIKSALEIALSGRQIRIEHIGSTAIPGLAAKPIIDIDIVYNSDLDFPGIEAALDRAGYVHEGDFGIPGREVFKRKQSNPQHHILDETPHHLYACAVDSAELKRHILFRDYLRNHHDARKKYQELKMQIAAEAKQDRKAYAELKEKRARGFVHSILDSAALS